MRVARVAFALGALGVAGCHRQLSSEDHTSHMGATGGSVALQDSPRLPASRGNAPARLAASPRRGEWVKVAYEPGSRDTIMAWIVYPAASRAKAPVVVVVHDIGGLTTWARAVADQAASEGFIAVSPDFISRARGAPSVVELPRDSVGKLMATVNSGERNRLISAVANYAMSQPTAERKYGVIGYCWGGQTVFMHAVNGGTAGFSGGVAYYGLPYMAAEGPNADSLTKIKAPVMLFNGSKDARISAAMPAVEAEMKRLGKSYASTNYDGATHGFMAAQDDPKATRDLPEEAANLAATKDAWPRTIEFLKKNLGVK